MKKKKFRLSAWQYLAIGYLGALLIGSILLILPFATADGQTTSYLNALFTSASATCITGLAPYDTGTHWTLFGQIVILILIQFGGLGFMTIVSSIFMIMKRNMGLSERTTTLLDTGGGSKFSDLKQLVKRILIGTVVFEVLGALLLCIRFIPEYGAGTGIYFAIWHSISAFCNAGFDLMGSVGKSSLTSYAGDPLVSLTICALIMIGGLGFMVWSDIVDCKHRIKKYQLNTKVLLFVNLIIWTLSTLLFLAVEWNNPSYADFNGGEKLLASFFNAVTARTAGFYSTAPETLSESGVVLMIMLMFIGGSSGSTAGGIKVGTFTVIVTGMLATFRGSKDINVGKKRIEYSLLSQALAIFAACLIIIILSSFIICALEPELPAQYVLFECTSALSNTGLSMGMEGGTSCTSSLNVGSRIIIILLMYAGRIGILTLALALGGKRKTGEVRRPVDTLLIG